MFDESILKILARMSTGWTFHPRIADIGLAADKATLIECLANHRRKIG